MIFKTCGLIFVDFLNCGLIFVGFSNKRSDSLIFQTYGLIFVDFSNLRSNIRGSFKPGQLDDQPGWPASQQAGWSAGQTTRCLAGWLAIWPAACRTGRPTSWMQLASRWPASVTSWLATWPTGRSASRIASQLVGRQPTGWLAGQPARLAGPDSQPDQPAQQAWLTRPAGRPDCPARLASQPAGQPASWPDKWPVS